MAAASWLRASSATLSWLSSFCASATCGDCRPAWMASCKQLLRADWLRAEMAAVRRVPSSPIWFWRLALAACSEARCLSCSSWAALSDAI